LAELHRTKLLDSPAEEAFDRLTRIAAASLRTPIALVSLVDGDRQFFKSCHGLPEPWASAREIPLTHSFCQHVVAREQPLIVVDAREDPLVRENPAIAELGVIAYAGVPLTTSSGEVLGTFCVVDTQPRHWTEADIVMLTDLAAAVMTEIELRSEMMARQRAQDALQSVVLGTAAATSSEGFFRSLVGHLASALGVRYAFVGVVRPEDGRILTLAMSADGQQVPQTTFAMEGTPCEQVMARGPQYYSNDVQGQFPRALILGELRADSYIGVPIVGVSGTSLGIVSALHDHPIEDPEAARAVLTILAARAGAELERARAEEALRRTGALSAAILAVSLDCVIAIDQHGLITEFNAAAEQTFGYRRAEVIGLEMADVIVPPAQRDGHRRGLARYLAGGEARMLGRRMEVTAMRSDGTEFPAELAITRVPVDGPPCFTGFLRDITEQKRAVELLREKEEQFRALIEDAWDTTMVIGARGDITYASPAIGRVLGICPDAIMGKNVLDLVHPEDLQQASQTLCDALERPDGSVSAQVRFRHANGGWRTLAGTGRNLLTRKSVQGIVVNLRDVTDERQLTEQLRQAQRLEAVGQLAGGIAHDFNNLVTIVKVNGELLSQSLGATDPRRRDVEEIQEAADRAAGLTRQLLAFSRRQLLQPRVLALNVVIAGMSPLLGRLIGEDIELAVLPSPSDVHVSADAGQLEQVLVNLVVNARDAMPSGGRITVETSIVELDHEMVARHAMVVPGAYAMLAVSDTGIGMSSDVQKRIFEPFFTTKDPGKGTGLGLATVYGIVQQSGGYIWVYSEPGHGTTFKVYLPSVAATPRADTEAVAPRIPRGTETVLLVEDDEAVRGLAARVLGRQGYTVLQAPSGSDALTLAHQYAGHIHLLLTDVVMPQMNGRQLAEHLFQIRPATRVLFMSGYTDDDIIRRGLLDLETAFLEKPFTVESLAETTRQTLDRKMAPASA
jgi:PAS domain S-box-containing protein